MPMKITPDKFRSIKYDISSGENKMNILVCQNIGETTYYKIKSVKNYSEYIKSLAKDCLRRKQNNQKRLQKIMRISQTVRADDEIKSHWLLVGEVIGLIVGILLAAVVWSLL